jgi:hypothetical protein
MGVYILRKGTIMQVFIVVGIGILLFLAGYANSQLRYISDLLRDEKKPFLREDSTWNNVMYLEGKGSKPEVKPKKASRK